MRFLVPDIFNIFRTIPEGFYRNNRKYFNTTVLKSKFKTINDLDPYGSYKVSNEYCNFNILNDFSDEFISSSRINQNSVIVFTPCIVREDFIIEVADIIYTPYIGLEMVNHKYAEIPEKLKRLGTDAYCGKQAFYYNVTYLSLKLNKKYTIEKKHKHIGTNGWIASPRVKIYLKKIK